MPRTRIRRGSRLTVNTGGSQTGDGTNPPGSSLTTDDIGTIDIGFNEPAATPADAATFALSVTSSEVNLTPEEQSQFFAIMQSLTDPANTPTEARATELKAGATTVTQTVGTGWTNPTNAQGLPDGATATINSPAGLGPARVTGTLVGSYASVGTPSLETQTGTVTLDFTWTLTLAALTTGSLILDYSTDSGGNYTNVLNQTATGSGTATATITLPIANLANLRFRAAGSVQGSAIGASTATLDAVVVTYNLTGV